MLARIITIVLFTLATSDAFALCDDTGLYAGDTGITLGDEDCDGDGFTKWGDGDPDTHDADCDDENYIVNPGHEVDDCHDSFDNDCDGFFNEGCEYGFSRGTLLGGSACGDGDAVGLLLLPLLLVRRWWQ